jgi:mannose-1-phosphate guanylyltransferase
MILCAGHGTRLEPLSSWCAKPLVPVGAGPVLAHVLERVAGASRIVVNAHHRAEDLHAFVAARSEPLAVSEEPELLGTAGGIARAATLLGEGDVLVWNGDILADVDAEALSRAHAGDGTLVVRPRTAGEGNVGVDARGHVVRLRRETVRDGEVRGGDFLGVHVLGAALRRALPARGGLIEDAYLPAIRAGAEVGVSWFDGTFRDIGTIASYHEANLAWLSERRLGSLVGVGATLAPGVSLRASIVGDGAVVEGTGALERCVVWPRARATAPLENAIVATEGLVRA